MTGNPRPRLLSFLDGGMAIQGGVRRSSFDRETDIEAGRFEGKVEHIASYKATRFHSLDELLAFIAGALTEITKTQPT